MGQRITICVFLILCAALLRSQSKTNDIALIKISSSFDYGIYESLDLVKNQNQALAGRFESLKLKQRADFSQMTCQILHSVADSFPNFLLDDYDALADYVPYPDGVPAPIFPKRIIKKKGKKMPYRHYLICQISISHSLSSNGLVGFRPSLNCEIQLLNKKGQLVKKSRKTSRTQERIKSSAFGSVFSKTNEDHLFMLNEMIRKDIEMLMHETLSALNL